MNLNITWLHLKVALRELTTQIRYITWHFTLKVTRFNIMISHFTFQTFISSWIYYLQQNYLQVWVNGPYMSTIPPLPQIYHLHQASSMNFWSHRPVIGAGWIYLPRMFGASCYVGTSQSQTSAFSRLRGWSLKGFMVKRFQRKIKSPMIIGEYDIHIYVYIYYIICLDSRVKIALNLYNIY